LYAPSPSTSPAPSPGSAKPAAFPGYLLIADRGNNRALLVDGNKNILWRYPARGTNPSMPFRFDDDTFFTPGYGSIISNQEEQHTIQEISFPQGKVIWHYGHVNHPGSASGYLHTPDDAYRLANGVTTVADATNCRVLFISPKGKVQKEYGQAGHCTHNPPHQLGQVNGDTPTPNGGVLISEITGSWVDYISKNGKLNWAFQAPVSYPSDPQWLGHGKILMADYSNPGAALIVNTRGHVLWKYSPNSGSGKLDHPSLAMMLPNGLIAVNDDYRDRVVLIDPKTNKIVWQYGRTDKKGKGAGYLNTPDGMDFLPFAEAQKIPLIAAAASAAQTGGSKPGA
jgi:outer membrane protein assembly factor BamB